MQHYGIYKETTCYDYDDEGGGSHSYETVLGTDKSKSKLAMRWNAAQDAERAKLKAAGRHISYINNVPPNFESGKFRLEYYGSNGGGYRSVEHCLTIKLIPQFDEQEETKKANS